jgi:hypothetical protein
MPTKNQPDSVGLSAILTIPELEQSKAAVLNTLASQHSRRIYESAIERFSSSRVHIRAAHSKASVLY